MADTYDLLPVNVIMSEDDEEFLSMCDNSYLPDEMKEELKNLILKRIQVIK